MSTRRAFLGQVGAGAGAAAALAVTGPVRASARAFRQSSTPAPVTDADILNFALNLEYLEAEFYTVATTGKYISDLGFSTDGAGTKGIVSGGHSVQFSTAERRDIALQIAKDERAHVALLRAALGSAAVAEPAINLDALGIGFDSERQFIQLSRAFEDTGVSAYGGAAPFITNKLYLSVAARILSAENQHTAIVRYLDVFDEIDFGVIGKLDHKDRPPADWQYFSLTYEGLSIIRSPREVLDIVFHSTGQTKGGFYPNGVNSSNLAGLAAIPSPDLYPVTIKIPS